MKSEEMEMDLLRCREGDNFLYCCKLFGFLRFLPFDILVKNVVKYYITYYFFFPTLFSL